MGLNWGRDESDAEHDRRIHDGGDVSDVNLLLGAVFLIILIICMVM